MNAIDTVKWKSFKCILDHACTTIEFALTEPPHLSPSLAIMAGYTNFLLNASFTQMSWVALLFAAFLALIPVIRHWILNTHGKWAAAGGSNRGEKRAGPVRSDIDPNVTIEPLDDLDLEKAAPIPYLPYKFQGHVTMGIQKRERQDWIRMDRGYLGRIQDRRQLIDEHPNEIIGTGELVNAAIRELYEEVMIDYLPKRFPTMFVQKPGEMLNLATNKTFPTDTASLSPERMLELMGTNVEEDFYFMCPDEKDDQYRLRGYIACFPGGFLSPARVGESVREIHRPVPGYDQKLGLSVDRYFARMEPRQFIGRMNVSLTSAYRSNHCCLTANNRQWSLQVDGADLFRVDGNNFYPGMDADAMEEKFDPKMADCYLRVEHQTLCKLPKSGAVIFCVRSYMTSLEEMRERGEAKELADAITSMPERLAEYKMRHLWGDKILPWLRA